MPLKFSREINKNSLESFKKPMNSRDYVLKTVSHKLVDSIPIDIGSSLINGLHYSHIIRLRNHFKLKDEPVKIVEPLQMLGEIKNDLKEALGIDTTGILPYRNAFGVKNTDWKNWQIPEGPQVLIPGNLNFKVDHQNNIYAFPEGHTDSKPSAIMDSDASSFRLLPHQKQQEKEEFKVRKNTVEFKIITDEELDYLEEQLILSRNDGRAKIFTSHDTFLGNINYVMAPYLENPEGIRSLEKWYSAHLTKPDFIRKIYQRQTELALANLSRINSRIGNYIDIILVCATDFGGQNSLLISPQIFRQLYKPFYQKINHWIHENTDWKTMKHSCGAITKIIPDFIECGFDILHPLQFSALNMDPVTLKNRFGDKIALWGNCIESKILSSVSRDKLQKTIESNCKILSKDGGYVFSLENLHSGIPFENIITLVNSIQEI
jgi:hypothetical protein